MARLLLIIVGFGLLAYGVAGWFELVPIDRRIPRRMTVAEVLAGKAERYELIRIDDVKLELSKGIEKPEIGAILYPIQGTSGRLVLSYWNQLPRPDETLTIYGSAETYDQAVPPHPAEPAKPAWPSSPEFPGMDNYRAAPATAPATQSAPVPAMVLDSDYNFLPRMRKHASFWMGIGGGALALALVAQISVWVGRSRLAAETRLPISASDEPCFTCGCTMRLIPCFLRVKAHRAIGYKRYRNRSFETRCGTCPACYRKFRAAQNRRAGLVAVFWIACWVSPLIAMVTRSLPFVFVAVPVTMVGGFFLISAWMNTLYDEALGQPLSDGLKSRVDVSSWNMTDRIRIVRRGY